MKKVLMAVAVVVFCSALIAWQVTPNDDGASITEPEAADPGYRDAFSLPGAIAASISGLDYSMRMAVTVIEMAPLVITGY